MEHVVNTLHRILQRALITHVADVEFYLAGHLRHTGLEIVAHIVLFLLIAGEDADFADVGAKETVQNRVAEGTGTAGNKKDFVFKY